jgi:hypothetical protein
VKQRAVDLLEEKEQELRAARVRFPRNHYFCSFLFFPPELSLVTKQACIKSFQNEPLNKIEAVRKIQKIRWEVLKMGCKVLFKKKKQKKQKKTKKNKKKQKKGFTRLVVAKQL